MIVNTSAIGRPQRLDVRPPGELFSHRIQQRDARIGIGGDHTIANGVERHGQLLLAVAQRDVRF